MVESRGSLSSCAVDKEKAHDRQMSFCFAEVFHPIMLDKIISQGSLISAGTVRDMGRDNMLTSMLRF